jgi:hypothetical protein
VALTVAPGITAPLESWTVPWIRAVLCAQRFEQHSKKINVKTLDIFTGNLRKSLINWDT